MKNHAQILLIDDDALSIQHSKLVFKKAKITNILHTCSSGTAALDFLLKRNDYDDAPDIDLIYCDMHMPKMSGAELLEIIQTTPALSHIPLIMFTSSSDTEDIDISSDLGAVAYIEKPLNVQKVMDTILLHQSMKITITV